MPVTPATSDAIAEAARLLRAGRLVAFPTETVYGLGADATDGRAVAGIFEAKGRPRFNPLIVHAATPEAAFALGRFGPVAASIAEAFWPGPLSLVVARPPDCRISELVTAGLDTIALRVPSHPVAQALLATAGIPIAAPSANPSGRISPTTAEHVAADLGGRPALILDGGPCAHGIESTVIDATGPEVMILRSGAVTAAEIERVTGRLVTRAGHGGMQPRSPGMLAHHYAPRAAVRLDAHDVRPGEALLAFGPAVPTSCGPVLNLSPGGDLREAAANLFAALRTLDRSGAAVIAVMPIPDQGLGEAINERLRRAAAPR